MERFLAICHPLHLYAMSGFKRALRIITALWIISFLSATPFAIFTTIDYVKYPVGMYPILFYSMVYIYLFNIELEINLACSLVFFVKFLGVNLLNAVSL